MADSFVVSFSSLIQVISMGLPGTFSIVTAGEPKVLSLWSTRNPI